MKIEEMVEQFQCPGCVCGGDTSCGKYAPYDYAPGVSCSGHVPGTSMLGPSGLTRINLGLPKGFNRGAGDVTIRLHLNAAPLFDKFNVAVWVLEQNGFLFVRTYSPRTDMRHVDIFRKGKAAEICPDAIVVDPEEMD